MCARCEISVRSLTSNLEYVDCIHFCTNNFFSFQQCLNNNRRTFLTLDGSLREVSGKNLYLFDDVFVI